MPTLAPAFPLGRTAFAAALRTGHGRALQQVERHGSAGLDDLIIEACVTCLTYDPQCEANRAPWLASIANCAGLGAKVVESIEALTRIPPPENHRDMEQRSALLKELAERGFDRAHPLLYSSLVRLTGTSDVIAADQIVALDGEAGLIHVARQLGRWLQADPNFWVDESIVSQLDESAGSGTGLAVLEREAASDPDIARYLDGVRATRESQRRHSSQIDATAYSGADIVALVQANPKEQCHWLRRWGAQADSGQIELVFAALLASSEPDHVKRLFRCFAKIGVPRYDDRLLRWLTHSDGQIRWAAVKALAPLTHPRLREAAKSLIAGGDMADGIAILVNNFEVSDFAEYAGQLDKVDDADEAHHLGAALLDLCKAHPGSAALDCLLEVYEHSPCSTCRRQAVEAMIGANTAPAWLLTESAFDADPASRELCHTPHRHG